MQLQFPIGKSILTELELSLVCELENWTFLSRIARWPWCISRTTKERLQFQSRAVQGGRCGQRGLERRLSLERESAGQRTLPLS